MSKFDCKTIKGKLIEVVIEEWVKDSLFEQSEEVILENLHYKMHNNLKFDFEISDVKIGPCETSGQISFEISQGIYGAVNFNVTPAKVLFLENKK